MADKKLIISSELAFSAAEYYASARAAVPYHFFHVSGVLFHHSFEMILKASLHLLPNFTLKKYSHNLPDLWDDFCKEYQVTSNFSETCKALHFFETIRYPESTIDHTQKISIVGMGVIYTGTKTGTINGKTITLNLDTLEPWWIAIHKVSRINPFCASAAWSVTARNLYESEALKHEFKNHYGKRHPTFLLV